MTYRDIKVAEIKALRRKIGGKKLTIVAAHQFIISAQKQIAVIEAHLKRVYGKPIPVELESTESESDNENSSWNTGT